MLFESSVMSINTVCLVLPCIDGSIISKWVFEKYDGLAWNEFMWLRMGKYGMPL
jgi:hypothetical protein